MQFLASTPRGFSDLLARELESFGALEVRDRSTSVQFSGGLEILYRVCLRSRLANRVFLELARFEAPTTETLYFAAREVEWGAHIASNGTIACDFTGKHPTIINSQFGALKLKDAICDALRAQTGQRPSVSIERPDVRVHAHSQGVNVVVSLDLSGESLHRRGYRTEAGEAPVKENLAAGILVRSGWPALAAQGAAFLDPLCGSGTFVIEAAMIAAGIAPGLRRDYFGFLRWRGHDPELFKREREAALADIGTVVKPLRGRDRDPTAIRVAAANARRAGVDKFVSFEVGDLENLSGGAALLENALSSGAGTALTEPQQADAAQLVQSRATSADVPAAASSLSGAAAVLENAFPSGAGTAPAAPQQADAAQLVSNSATQGLLCTNPPYGVRLEDRDAATLIHRELGKVLRNHFLGWHAAVLTGSVELGHELGIRAHRTHTIWNGPLECRLVRIEVTPENFREPGRFPKVADDPTIRESPGARMFSNRLEKNIKRLRSWTKRSAVSCYRLYDADMPEYAFAVDQYRAAASEETWLHVQEYAAPTSIDEESVRRRRREALSVLPETTGVPQDHIHLKTRRRATGGEQYRKLADRASFHVVEEGGLKFEVNFNDYLDTGLFLDHRMTRSRLRDAARGKRFLNLFAYTGTATVYAASGGARSTVSVDLSRTYLDWAQRNLSLNGFNGRDHQLIQADCLQWLADAARSNERFDLIFLDPPTFSNSKRMDGVLDVLRDHADLVDASMRLLARDGLMVFSTNAQRFRIDEALQGRYQVKDISAATLPMDFERNPKIHRAFELALRAGTPEKVSTWPGRRGSES